MQIHTHNMANTEDAVGQRQQWMHMANRNKNNMDNMEEQQPQRIMVE
jgi:hypothetical protein